MEKVYVPPPPPNESSMFWEVEQYKRKGLQQNLAQTNDTSFSSTRQGGGGRGSHVYSPPKRILSILGKGAAQTNDICFIVIRGGGGEGDDMHLNGKRVGRVYKRL